jgi:16S rRNA (guanine527-N7)-methyltransferase
MINASDDLVRDTLSPYGFLPSHTQCSAIKTYISLLLQWNKRISLTTIVDPIEILRFHFGESLYAAVCIPILNGRLADVGSGAGFPGLPLRIALPDLAVTAIESNAKKAAFLREIAQHLELDKVEVVRDRMENITAGPVQYDFVASRALGNYASLLEWARTQLSPSGKILLWLGEADASSLMADSEWCWSEPAHIPGTKRRIILAGSPIR